MTRPRPRARDLGIPFEGTPGTHNAITDVPGVQVGYETLIQDDAVRTGVTAVLPLGREGVGHTCPAGWFSLNGNGEMTGTAWLDETGALALPIAITNTHAIGPVHRGIIEWAIHARPDLAEQWLLPVVAETWDGYLNDINGPAHHPRDGRARTGRSHRRTRGRGLGRRRHRHELLRLQGRHRHRVAPGAGRRTQLHRRCAHAGQLRRPPRIDHRRPPRRPTTRQRGQPDRGQLVCPHRRRLVHHHHRHRRTPATRTMPSPRPPRPTRPRPHRHHRQPLLRRPVPRLLCHQQRRAQHRNPRLASRTRASVAASSSPGAASTPSTKPSFNQSKKPCSTSSSPERP